MSRLALTLILLLIPCGLGKAVSADSRPLSKGERLMTMKLQNVHIEAQGMGALFSQLSLSYDIPVGLEIAFDDDPLATYDIDFEKGTLRELLTEFVNKHNKYTWRLDGGVVNIFPVEAYRDPFLEKLLLTEIRRFSVKKKTSCWNLAQSLASTPEVAASLQQSGITFSSDGLPGGFYIQQLGQDFTLDVSKAQVKSILNKVVKDSPLAKIWIIRKDSLEQTLSVNLSARFEHSANAF